MKNIFAIILSLTLLLNPAGDFAHAEPKKHGSVPQTEEVQQQKFDPQVKAAIYDLDHVKDVLKELDYIYNDVAPLGYSKQIVRELHDRLMGAQKLISQILLDEKMTDEEKDSYLSDLVPSFGAAWLKIYRFQNEDSMNDARAQEYYHIPEVKEILQKISKAQRGSEDWDNLHEDLIDTLNYLEATDVKPRSQEGNVMVRFLRGMVKRGKAVGAEALMDLKAVLTFNTTAKKEHIWTMLSRAYRGSASQDAVRVIAELTLSTLPQMKEGDLLNKQREFWLKDLVHVMRLRSHRLMAQRAMVATYFGIAMTGLLFPMVDVVGLMDGGWSENSLWVSSVFYAASWSVVGSLKFASYSKRTVDMLQTVTGFLKDGKKIDEKSMSDLQRKSLFDRIMRVFPKNKKGCDVHLAAAKEGDSQ